MSCLLCRQSARVHAEWSEKCRYHKYWSSSLYWPLCKTFVQSGNVDSMDYGIAAGFVLCLRVPTEIKALLWLVLHTHRKRWFPSQSLQSNRQDRWKTGSRRGTQKWSDLPEVTQQVSDRAKNKKPCYFLPAWYPLPKAMHRISLRLKCSVFWRAVASSRMQLHCGMMGFTFCKGALRTVFVGLEHRHCSVSLCGLPLLWLFSDLAA